MAGRFLSRKNNLTKMLELVRSTRGNRQVRADSIDHIVNTSR